MRVTKIIREYIQEQVYAAIPTENLYQPYVEKRDEIKQAVEEANDKLEAYRKQLMEEIKTNHEMPEDWTFSNCTGTIDFRCYNTALSRENNRLGQIAASRRTEALKDILLTLELEKVSKDELSKIIAEAVGKK